METKRNMATIARKTGLVEQNTQHFMSHSPWSGPGLLGDIQGVVAKHAEFQSGAMLVVDESADQKAGAHSAGAGRQHNGRLGKIEMSQVGVFAALVTPRVNTWIDGELFFPAHWFDASHAEQRRKVEFPKDRTFKTKPELAGDIIQRIQRAGIRFEAVAMDDLYGRNAVLRKRLDDAHIEYYGDIPANTIVSLDKPQIFYPITKRGKPSKNYQVVAKQRHTVSDLYHHPGKLVHCRNASGLDAKV